jgi:hypothetical protein
MLKRVKSIMFIIIGTTFGVWLGNVLFTWHDYRKNPGLYEMQSAPWYTQIIFDSFVCGIALLAEIAIQCYICHKIKADEKRA